MPSKIILLQIERFLLLWRPLSISNHIYMVRSLLYVLITDRLHIYFHSPICCHDNCDGLTSWLISYPGARFSTPRVTQT